MTELPFRLDLIQFLADHRSAFLTDFFLLTTFIGDVGGYILIIVAIYVLYDKRLAFRLAAVVLLTMCLNHLLKIVIKNPRPFIHEGTYFEKWAVSPDNARVLATEYSTPSGHAMGAAAFYSYLYAKLRDRSVRVIAILAILLTGLSRPYLGVHYLEDVLIGWAIGIAIVVLAVRYEDAIQRRWSELSSAAQALAVVAASILLWSVTIAMNGWTIGEQPRAFLTYTGFLAGIVIGAPLERKHVGFDPRSSTVLAKMLRYAISVASVLITLLVLDRLFDALAEDSTLLGQVLRYVRYALAGVAATYGAPLLFTRIGWAEKRAANSSIVGLRYGRGFAGTPSFSAKKRKVSGHQQ